MNDSNKILSIERLGFPWKTQDPFLFCAYHRDEYPAGNEAMGVDPGDLQGRNIGQDFVIKNGWRMYHGSAMPGFPYHPHRGFETITINKEGVVDHSDSLGAAGRFMAGDVQWMTAGSGILHSEMFPLIHADAPNTLEIFQIWLNLPKRSKMVDPHFKMLWKEQVPTLKETDSNGHVTHVDLIAGTMNGTTAAAPTPDSWAADSENAVGVYTLKMDPQAEWKLPATNEHANRTIFFYAGNHIEIEEVTILANHRIEAEASAELTFRNGDTESYLLILEGAPIKEPVVQHGPFVMNTADEIRETMKEFQQTQFGGWPWTEREVAHPRTKGRFALHADGKEEIK